MKSKLYRHSTYRCALPLVFLLAFGALVLSTSPESQIANTASAATAQTLFAQEPDLDLSALDEGSTPESDASSEPQQSSGNASEDNPAPVEKPVQANAKFVDLVLASGWIGAILLLCSIVAVSMIIRIALSLRRSKFMPEEALREIKESVARGSYSQATSVASNDDSFLARVALAGLKESDRGWSAMEKALEDASAEQTAALYRRTEPLSVIGNVAPMLGLLGTVVGMVTTFGELAVADAGGRNLANGIYFALVTTVDGLIVAIPVLVAHSVLNARIAALVSEALDKLNSVFEPAKRQLAAPGNANVLPVQAPAPVRGLREVTPERRTTVSPSKPQGVSESVQQDASDRPAPQSAQRPSLSLKNRQ